MKTGKFSNNIRVTENGLVSGVDRVLKSLNTSAIDLIHSERVSTSTSSFFAHRLAYCSHASMLMPKFWCHEYKTGSLYFGPLLKWSLSFLLRTTLRSPVAKWQHGAYINWESEQLQEGVSCERPWKSSCSASLVVDCKSWTRGWDSLFPSRVLW